MFNTIGQPVVHYFDHQDRSALVLHPAVGDHSGSLAKTALSTTSDDLVATVCQDRAATTAAYRGVPRTRAVIPAMPADMLLGRKGFGRKDGGTTGRIHRQDVEPLASRTPVSRSNC